MCRFLVFLAFALLQITQAVAQLDAYKYIIVPTKFDGFKQSNQFNTSTLIKYYFTEAGFNPVYENDLPADLYADRCTGLMTRFIDNSSLFATKVVLSLTDCKGNVVFESTEGSSKLKEFDEAYKEAINEAFVSFRGMSYQYTPKATQTEPEAAKKQAVVPAVESEGIPSPKETTPAEAPEKNIVAEKITDDAWVAVPIPNGYKLDTGDAETSMKLLKSSNPDTFMAFIGDQPRGMVYKKDGIWWHEYYEAGELKNKELRIRF
ncbi:hypothetical protein ACT6NV_09700 [Robiginitalea sp. IMCC44478]|uniref:hypothetical protein n=1 Tax=Robiginitalea sp. IMCC44478 TaxID=3459122 RepID=UPI004042F373